MRYFTSDTNSLVRSGRSRQFVSIYWKQRKQVKNCNRPGTIQCNQHCSGTRINFLLLATIDTDAYTEYVSTRSESYDCLESFLTWIICMVIEFDDICMDRKYFCKMFTACKMHCLFSKGSEILVQFENKSFSERFDWNESRLMKHYSCFNWCMPS